MSIGTGAMTFTARIAYPTWKTGFSIFIDLPRG